MYKLVSYSEFWTLIVAPNKGFMRIFATGLYLMIVKKVFSCLFDFRPRQLIKIKCSAPVLSSFVHTLEYIYYVTYTYAHKELY